MRGIHTSKHTCIVFICLSEATISKNGVRGESGESTRVMMAIRRWVALLCEIVVMAAPFTAILIMTLLLCVHFVLLSMIQRRW